MKMTGAQIVQMNDAQRMKTIQESVPTFRPIQTQTALPGTTSRFKILNTGLLTKLLLDVRATLTIGTADATVSPKGPYNLIQNLAFTDFANNKRYNISGHHLYALNSARMRTNYGRNNGAGADVLANPSQPVAVGAVTVSFLIEVPIAFDPDNPTPAFRDLRGAVWCQSNNGEAYLTIDWNPTLVSNGNANGLYNGAATTTVVVAGTGITCTLYQEYLAVPNPNTLPMLDITTSYEVNGNVISTDNIAVGQERFFPVPNFKRVLRMFFTYQQATAMTAGLMTRIRTQVNGNTDIYDATDRVHIFKQRELLGFNDLVPGLYILDFTQRPIETAILGNVQIGFTPGTVGATPNYESTTEAFVPLGSPAVGPSQAAGV